MIKEEIKKIIGEFVSGEIDLTIPPKPEMGDLAFACFGLAKEQRKSPVEAAKELKIKLDSLKKDIIEKVEVFGPYVNFFIRSEKIAEELFKQVSKKEFGKTKTGKGKKIMVEYACPNTNKPVHIGHLRNLTTGESLARIFENAGYKVIRTNYNGDVGLHIAKSLWGIGKSIREFEEVRKKDIHEKANFLGRVYALGGQAYENDEQAKKEIAEINEKIYNKDKEATKIYSETREWSLQYFDEIYKKVGAKFDRLYFESETFERGKKLVLENLKKGIFKESDGAVIFEGENYGLHNRVFLNSAGLPTYEAKDVALAFLQLKEFKPDAIFHVVGKEQTEYFKVLFKALEYVFPKSKGKEFHLMYGWVSLKEGKMSSRTGNVILAEWLLSEAKNSVLEAMVEHEIENKEEVAEKIALAAVKYSFLRTSAQNDIEFDLKQAASLTGDSGPYLLYIIARIKSILRKKGVPKFRNSESVVIEASEKKLLIDLANFAESAQLAAVQHDPSKIAHYLLSLAQDFNIFYNSCPVLKAEGAQLSFRLNLIQSVLVVMTKGLNLLGIETVEEM